MKTFRAYVIEESRYHDYLVLFRHGNKTVKSFRFHHEDLRHRSDVSDPIFWKEDTDEDAVVPRDNKGTALYEDDYYNLVLYDAVNILGNYLRVNHL